MILISYGAAVLFISLVWLLVRAGFAIKAGKVDPKREAQLLLVYICIIVVVRFTFFPFFKVDGAIQPLVFDAAKILPFRINPVPLVNLLDYPSRKEILINVIGNSTMFLPVGVIFPLVFRQLNTHGKAIAAGVGFSLCIEILQLPIFDRVSDIDDLLLNSLGYGVGYLIYLAVRRCRKKH